MVNIDVPAGVGAPPLNTQLHTLITGCFNNHIEIQIGLETTRLEMLRLTEWNGPSQPSYI